LRNQKRNQPQKHPAHRRVCQQPINIRQHSKSPLVFGDGILPTRVKVGGQNASPRSAYLEVGET
jgi:hypothetical protein